MQEGEPQKQAFETTPLPSTPAPTVPTPVVSGEQYPPAIVWEASEYLEHNNGKWWYVGFFAVAALLIVIAILLGAYLFVAVVVVMAIAGILHVRRPPRVVRYVLDDDGLQIGERDHPFGDFKSFSVIRDGAFYAILLQPLKRFSPSTLVYFDEADGEDIVDALGTHLPMEDRDLDTLDRFLRLIRF